MELGHSCRATIPNKNSLWLLLFFMTVAASCSNEKLHRTMHAAIVSYLFKDMFFYCLKMSFLNNFFKCAATKKSVMNRLKLRVPITWNRFFYKIPDIF